MTHITLALNNYLLSPIEGLIDAFRSFNKKIERQKAINATIKELSKLSNRELNDIGIARGDIWAIAHDDTTHLRRMENV
jgi:uncharacterized protein YjiS (DUF1127 family)